MNINNELYLLHLLQKQINEKYNKQKFMVGLRKKKIHHCVLTVKKKIKPVQPYAYLSEILSSN